MSRRRNRNRRNTRFSSSRGLRFSSVYVPSVFYAPSFRSTWSSFTPTRYRPTQVLFTGVRSVPRNDRPFGGKSRAIARMGTVGVVSSESRSKVISLCERRSQRREVMFATNKAGISGQRRAVWTPESKKRCK